MPKLSAKTWIIVTIVVVAALAFFGYQFWQSRRYAVPSGIASGNGRIEAKLADVSAKEPLRVKEVLVNEGDLVKPGQILVRLDTVTLEAQLEQPGGAMFPRSFTSGEKLQGGIAQTQFGPIVIDSLIREESKFMDVRRLHELYVDPTASRRVQEQVTRITRALQEQQYLAAVARPRVVFLFPGQGSQHPGMVRGLYDEAPAFREAFDRCMAIANPALGVDLGAWLRDTDPSDAQVAQALAEGRAAGTLAAAPLRFDRERTVRAASRLAFPGKVLADPNGGRLFVADSNHNRVVVSTLPDASGRSTLLRAIGTGRVGREDGPADRASFHHPQGLALMGETLARVYKWAPTHA